MKKLRYRVYQKTQPNGIYFKLSHIPPSCAANENTIHIFAFNDYFYGDPTVLKLNTQQELDKVLWAKA